MIRAYFPWPTVWSRIPVIARPQSGEAISSKQEKLIKFLPEQKIQMEGGKPMSMKDFRNGYPELEEKIKTIYTR
jgi:methionyl-tRNA formyltransferase